MAADRLPDPQFPQPHFEEIGRSGVRFDPAPAPAAVSPAEPLALIPGADPGACPKCGEWVKAGLLHNCPANPSVSPADTIRPCIAHVGHPTTRPYPEICDGCKADAALDALLAVGERDKAEIERLREVEEAARAFVQTTSSFRQPKESQPAFEALALILLLVKGDLTTLLPSSDGPTPEEEDMGDHPDRPDYDPSRTWNDRPR